MLANWMFFWQEADWGGAPEPEPEPEAADTRAVAGGGGHQKQNDYERLPADFWLVKARYLRFLARTVEKEEVHHGQRQPQTVPVEKTVAHPAPTRPPMGDGRLSLLLQARTAALARAAAAQSMGELRAVAGRLKSLSLDIAQHRANNERRAIEILLLDIF